LLGWTVTTPATAKNVSHPSRSQIVGYHRKVTV
jgi:hypothetical protein